MLIISRQPIDVNRDNSDRTKIRIHDSIIQVIATNIGQVRTVVFQIGGNYVTMKVGDFLPYKGGRIHIQYISANCVKIGLDYPEYINIDRLDKKKVSA